jgi:hypothetical protein
MSIQTVPLEHARIDLVDEPSPALRQQWLEEFEAAARRPLEQRMKYAFIHTHKPVLDDAPFRAFDTMANSGAKPISRNGWGMGDRWPNHPERAAVISNRRNRGADGRGERCSTMRNPPVLSESSITSGDSSPGYTAPTTLPPPRFRRFGMTGNYWFHKVEQPLVPYRAPSTTNKSSASVP